MLTLENLKAFKQDLSIISIELDELLKIRSEEKLFNSSDDYYNALKVCNYYPQDYFKLRLFDYDFCLRYNNKMKKFYIRTDSVKYVDFSNICFESLFREYKIKTQSDNNNIYIDSQYEFNDVVKIFGKFVKCMIDYYFNKQNLFAYELQ